MLCDRRQRETQLSAAQHVRVRVATAVRVRPENFSAECAAEMLKWLDVAAVDLELERRLLLVAGEGGFTDDQAHGVSEVEAVHATSYYLCHPRTRWHVSHSQDLIGP